MLEDMLAAEVCLEDWGCSRKIPCPMDGSYISTSTHPGKRHPGPPSEAPGFILAYMPRSMNFLFQVHHPFQKVGRFTRPLPHTQNKNQKKSSHPIWPWIFLEQSFLHCNTLWVGTHLRYLASLWKGRIKSWDSLWDYSTGCMKLTCLGCLSGCCISEK